MRNLRIRRSLELLRESQRLPVRVQFASLLHGSPVFRVAASPRARLATRFTLPPNPQRRGTSVKRWPTTPAPAVRWDGWLLRERQLGDGASQTGNLRHDGAEHFARPRLQERGFLGVQGLPVQGTHGRRRFASSSLTYSITPSSRTLTGQRSEMGLMTPAAAAPSAAAARHPTSQSAIRWSDRETAA